jgi:aspartate/methionine/tyrosine aminotransferase
MIELSRAAHRLKGQQMFQILDRVREMEMNGQDILHFELGDPDFDTPQNITQAACNSLKRGETHYAPSGGIREIKEAAAVVTLASRGFRPRLDQLLVCPGANVMIYYAIACAVNPGEEVIVPDPGFVSYFSIMSYLGVTPVRIPLLEKNEFRMNPVDVAKAITDKTRMIIINSPSNPTGALMTEHEIRDIYEIARERNIFLLSDEIYARMVYPAEGVKFFSPAGLDQCATNTIVVNGFSKSYAMTGWRLGVVTGPDELISKMNLLLETTTSCVSPFIQMAGVEALTGSQDMIYKMIEEYRKRRDIMVAGLNSLPGISCINPKGAFYVFPNIRNTHLTSSEFCEVMLEKAGVSLTPGPVFGDNGEGYVRLCYVNSIENIRKGIKRMEKVLKSCNC